MRTITILLTCLLFLLASCQYSDSTLRNATEILENGKDLFEEEAFERAETTIVRVIPVFEEQNDLLKLAEAHSYVGRTKLIFGQFGAALRQAEVAIEKSRSASDFRGEAKYLMLLGDVYSGMAYYEKAIEQYKSSLSFSSAFNDKTSVAALQMKLAKAYFNLEYYDQAQEHYENASDYYKSVGDKSAVGTALIGNGKILHVQERYDEARNFLMQAQNIIDPSDNPVLEAELRLSLGLVMRSQGDWNAALRHFRDGTNRLRAKRVGKDFETLLLFYLGRIYHESGRFQEAREFYSDAAAIARKINDRIAENYIAIFLLRLQEEASQRGEHKIDRVSLASKYDQLGDRFAYLQHKSGEVLARMEAGRVNRLLGQLDDALKRFGKAIEVDGSNFGEYIDMEFHPHYQRELGTQKLKEDGYYLAAKTALDLNRSDLAFQYLEKLRANVHFRLLQNTEIEIRFSQLRKDVRDALEKLDELRLYQLELSGILSNRYRIALQHQIDSLSTRIETLQQQLTFLGKRISGTYPNYYNLVIGDALTLSETQTLIPRATVILQFLPTDEELTLFAISRNSYIIRSVAISKDRLIALVREYQSLLRDPNVYAGAAGEASLRPMTRFAALSSQLYDIFLRPVDGMFERNLILIPSPTFENFPFHTLERQEPNGTVRYLIENTSVDYLPSFMSLNFRTVSAAKIRNVVGLGNPGGKNWSIDYELRDIRSFLKDARILIAMEATWDNLRISKGDVLQLSTDFKNVHRFSPLGTIAFSDPETVEESVDIPFSILTSLPPFPVTVLSNHYGSGTGLSPLQALLLRLNGTSDVFYNAWHSDRKTAKFFSEFFYTHLANGLAPGDAYRQALLNLIRTRDVNHPYQWGQFFHVGVG